MLYLTHAILHVLCAIVVIPYVALALFFVFVGEVASSKGMIGVLETLWNNFILYFGTVIYLTPVLWICLVAMGFLPLLQRAGSLCLSLIAVGSMTVMFVMHSSRWEMGELLFLVPCLAVVAISTVLVFRGNLGEPHTQTKTSQLMGEERELKHAKPN